MKQMKRATIYVVVALALLVGSLLPSVASAAETSTLPGSFTVGAVAPHFLGLDLYSDVNCTVVANSITPQVTYYIRWDILVPNTLMNLAGLKLKIFYDPGGAGRLESDVTAGNAQTAAIITWSMADPLMLYIDAGSPTSWSLVLEQCSGPADFTSSAGWGVIAFKAGKVATETVGADQWDIYAEVTSSSGLKTRMYRRGKDMLWYGEVKVNTSSVDWGTVTPGTGFADNVNEKGSVSVGYTANGDYGQRVKSTGTWTGSTTTANLDSSGTCASSRQFALKAWTADTFASATLLDTTGVLINNVGVQTAETGNTISTNTLWLKLADIFPVDVYSGTISYMISNR
ncbi:MAG: hypothetical protein NTU41_10880 [Chloroflexi bacterium]|nr:hypothetical protein [Chloroflexota bacterium]